MRLSFSKAPLRWMAASVAVALVGGMAASPAEAQTPKPRAKSKAKAKARPRQPAPTYRDVKYGDLTRQVLDFYQAKSDEPTPLVVFIHGGGWMGGDKGRVSVVDVKKLLDHGISVASVNYRFIPMAEEQGVKPPVKAPLEDAARAVQFLRSKAKDWNLDKTRVAASGSSAGACSSLWLLYHDDLARPDSPDPVARESTRLTAAAVLGAQTSLDAHQLREWMPNMVYGGHAFGFRKDRQHREEEFQDYYEHQDEVNDWVKEYSPYSQVSKDDPPAYLDFPSQKKPPVKGEEQKDPTHSAVLGLLLMEKLKQEGVEGHLTYPAHPDPEYASATDFLIDKLTPKSK